MHIFSVVARWEIIERFKRKSKKNAFDQEKKEKKHFRPRKKERKRYLDHAIDQEEKQVFRSYLYSFINSHLVTLSFLASLASSSSKNLFSSAVISRPLVSNIVQGKNRLSRINELSIIENSHD